MKRLTWIIVVLLAMPFSATAGLFGLWGSKSDVATKVATLNDDGEIYGLDFSPDGKHLAATPFDSPTVHIWQWQSNRLEQTLSRTRGSNVGVAEPVRYSPDGSLLAVCYEKGDGFVVARFWNTSTWSVVHDIDEPVGTGCDAIGFTSDGKALLRTVFGMFKSSEHSIASYDTSTWQVKWGLSTQFFLPSSLAISPDNKFVEVSGDDYEGGSGRPVSIRQQIAIVDMAQHVIVNLIKVESGMQGLVAWSPDGIHLAYGGEEGVEIFDVRSGTRVVVEKTNEKISHVHIRYTPDGKYFIESGFGQHGTKVRIWDGQHRELLQEINAIPGSMAVSRDGHYLAMGGEKKIIIWKLK